jgi:putative effector of murein hydrolase LrgA (UPF0299 family)
MTATLFFLLMFAIYLAPSLRDHHRFLLSFMFFVAAVVSYMEQRT